MKSAAKSILVKLQIKAVEWWEGSKSQNLTLGKNSIQFVYILSIHNKHSLRAFIVQHHQQQQQQNKPVQVIFKSNYRFFAVKVIQFCKKFASHLLNEATNIHPPTPTPYLTFG